MQIKEMYRVAKGYSRRWESSWRDDAVQDSVISAWEISSQGHKPAYLRTHIYRKLQNTIYYYGRRLKTEEYKDSLVTQDYYYCLPLAGEERTVAEKMIESNFQADYVAKTLGRSKSWVSKKWTRARKTLKEVYSEG